ncbi:putative plant non-specific lipid-transfer protein/Par allergen [Helianthus annuus]|nr:putative plant non-specific lipid-transfer protein/Par allergen [Helianthus annuus]
MWLLLWLLQKTIEDKLAACNCLKSASRSLNPNPALAKTLPGNYGISLGFSMSANIYCTKFSAGPLKGVWFGGGEDRWCIDLCGRFRVSRMIVFWITINPSVYLLHS